MENQINDQDLKEIIKEEVGELLERMNFSSVLEVEYNPEENEENAIICNIRTSDSSYLIGQYGVNLQALQHIARIIIRKKTGQKTNFILDINSYRQEKNESILGIAKSTAEKVLVEKRAIVMRPMSPYERRLVHLELSKNDQIETESVGEGEDRRIVIKPKNIV